MINIKRYNSLDKKTWDNFVSDSKNGTFLFYRDFIEYHSDRFQDHSLLFYLNQKLIAILPANISGNTLFSHQGLTYGGLVMSSYTKSVHVLGIFDKLRDYLLSNEINQLIYKAIPFIYHRQPAEEDLYALFRNDAKLIARSISSCIFLSDKGEYSELRKRGVKKALKNKLYIKESSEFIEFWKILENNLEQKHETKPTHSLAEIEYLKSKFPKNIQLFEIHDSSDILGGCTTFKSGHTTHVQYISASKEGKKIGALDYLFDELILVNQNNGFYFDFGTSTEKQGLFLNEGLINQKEGFGARAIMYDTYQLNAKR